MCVALGEVWKESLTELSGGQRYVASPVDLHCMTAFATHPCAVCRSLLALSLVLALLLFKPAPMYILDEVSPKLARFAAASRVYQPKCFGLKSCWSGR